MRIAILSPAAQSAQAISALLTQAHLPHVITRQEGGMAMLRTLVDHDAPDILILDGLQLNPTELESIEYVTAQYPHTFIIMLSADQTPELLMKAMRVGIREVLPAPVTSEVLAQAVARIESRIGLKNLPPKAEIIAFMSSKGGSGATFLSVNVGYQLAEEGHKVLLIDLNLQFGEAVLTLYDKKVTSDIVQVARNLSRLDASFLSASVTPIAPNYAILAAPDDPSQAQEVKPEHLDAILNLASTQYDFILLDVDRSLDDVTVMALDRATRIFLVVQTMLPYIRNANRLMTVFRSLGYAQTKVQVLVNRFWKNDEIGLDQLRASLGLSQLHTIPNGYKDVAKAINLGIPLASVSRSSPVFRAISELVTSLQPRRDEMQGSLLSRLLKR